MAELIVFKDGELAHRAGFDAKRRHRQDPHIVAWWPDLPCEDLYHLELSRVTVTDEVQRWAYAQRGYDELIANYCRAMRSVLPARLRLAPMIWMDL